MVYMRKIRVILVLTLLLVLIPMTTFAKEVAITNQLGIYVGGGMSSLLGNYQRTSTDIVAIPKIGGGMNMGVEYGLEYRHLLFRVGAEIDYSINNTMFDVVAFSMNVKEYPTMQYHYELNNYIEQDTYGVLCVPIKIGASFAHWYCLAGAKIGLFSFANYSRSATDITIWASDEDVIDPMINLPTHQLQTYHVGSEERAIELSSFNAMLSAEIGIKLDAELWRKSSQRVVVDDMQGKRSRVHYQLALVADYGLTNLHEYRANPIPYHGMKQGGLVEVKDVSKFSLGSMLGYEPYKDVRLNNLFVGVKLSVHFELPRKAKCNCLFYKE